MEQKQLLNIMAAAIDQALSNMHTCTIAKITAVNAKTINCKPVFNRVVDGQSIELPVFSEVPPIFLQGGSSFHAFPISVGDYALLFFTERCSDGWYNGQDFVAPLEYRMHDYSDGFALVGLNNLAGAITIPVVIQQTGDTNQDGDYTHQGDRDQTGNLKLTGDFNHIGDTIQTGDKQQTGTLTVIGGMDLTGSLTITSGDIVVDGISLKNHTHPQAADSGGDTQQNTGVAT